MTAISVRSSASPSGGVDDDWTTRLARFGLLGKGVVHLRYAVRKST